MPDEDQIEKKKIYSIITKRKESFFFLNEFHCTFQLSYNKKKNHAKLLDFRTN